ncbi:EcsC protein family protein [Actinokineospora terrae]|uniref:EcsC protein family protein n=1 Tax=Actinokineospora terrae TaxID=155974 RepID=A0A1H9VHK3_9PSEU|nr:EcsC protein family protein [Actinokineospora terrae]
MGIEDLSSYERTAWDELAAWRVDRLLATERHVLPRRARDGLARAGELGRGGVDGIPGAQQLVGTLGKALEGMLSVVNKAAEKSMRRSAVLAAYARRGHVLTDVEDIRKLDLKLVDEVKPHLGLRYASGTAVTGAATGLAVSGGELLATVGTVASAGAAAAPGAGTVVAALATDAAATLGAMTRAVARTAAFYGYDTRRPEEQVFALGVLNFGLAHQAGKSAAYLELNKIVQALARNATWARLNKNSVTRVLRVVYQRLGLRLTKQKLGQAVPIAGILIGAGLNARLLAKLADDADRLYRERFLRDKYGLPGDGIGNTPAADDNRADRILIADIVDGELDAEDRDADTDEQRQRNTPVEPAGSGHHSGGRPGRTPACGGVPVDERPVPVSHDQVPQREVVVGDDVGTVGWDERLPPGSGGATKSATAP